MTARSARSALFAHAVGATAADDAGECAVASLVRLMAPVRFAEADVDTARLRVGEVPARSDGTAAAEAAVKR